MLHRNMHDMNENRGKESYPCNQEKRLLPRHSGLLSWGNLHILHVPTATTRALRISPNLLENLWSVDLSIVLFILFFILQLFF